MPAKLTLHPPHRATRFLILRDGETLLVGRDPECTLVIEDARVSKRHARIAWTGAGWSLHDLGSKNGTCVNGLPAAGAPLAHGDWLSFGGILGRFEAVDQAQVNEHESERLSRLHTSVEMRRRLGAGLEPFDLLLRFLESAMELAGAERGFVLLGEPGSSLRVEVAAGFSPEGAEAEAFAGSLGAVRRALETGEPVVVCDAQADPHLGQRPSVVGLGLGTLACIPIRHEDELVGLLYVDGRNRSSGFTDLDVEILESLADHAGLAIAGMRLERRLRDLLRHPLAAREAGVLQRLQRRIDDAIGEAAGAP